MGPEADRERSQETYRHLDLDGMPRLDAKVVTIASRRIHYLSVRKQVAEALGMMSTSGSSYDMRAIACLHVVRDVPTWKQETNELFTSVPQGQVKVGQRDHLLRVCWGTLRSG